MMSNVKKDCYINSSFAEKLAEIMKEQGTTQKELADNIGVTRQAISQYTKGITQPTADIIVAIAKFFNVSTDYLLGVSDAKSTDMDIQGACKFFGVSEETITGLKVNIDEIRKYNVDLSIPFFKPTQEEIEENQKYNEQCKTIMFDIFEKILSKSDTVIRDIALNILKYRVSLDEDVFYSSEAFRCAVFNAKYYYYPDNQEERAFIEFKLSRLVQEYCLNIARFLPSLFTQEELDFFSDKNNAENILKNTNFMSAIMRNEIEENVESLLNKINNPDRFVSLGDNYGKR